MLCSLTLLPPQSVLTSRYTHPLPQYGDIHRSLTRESNIHTHTLLPRPHTYRDPPSTKLNWKPGDNCFDWVKYKDYVIAGREVVTASLVLLYPQKSGQDVGEQMSLGHQKTKQGVGKKTSSFTHRHLTDTISVTFSMWERNEWDLLRTAQVSGKGDESWEKSRTKRTDGLSVSWTQPSHSSSHRLPQLYMHRHVW